MKKNGIIGGLLLLLIAIYLIQEFKTPEKKQTAGYNPIVSESFTAEGIQEIAAYYGQEKEEGLRITRDSGREWRVDSRFGAPGKKEDIEGLFKNLRSMEGEKRASGKELFSHFSVEEERGYHLLLKGASGEELLHMIIGKKGPTYDSSFIRLAGSDEVYLTDKNIRTTLGIYEEENGKTPDSSKWVELKILSIAQDSISKVDMSEGKKKTLFEKRVKKSESGESVETEWIAIAKNEQVLEEEPLQRLLGSLASLRANEVLDPDSLEKYGLLKPQVKLVVTSQEGVTHTLHMSADKKEENRFYVKKEKEETVYLLAKYHWDNTVGKIRELGQGQKSG